MGVYNAVGPDDPSIGAVLDDVKAATGPSARLTWVDDVWLEKNDAAGWDAFPLAVSNTAVVRAAVLDNRLKAPTSASLAA